MLLHRFLAASPNKTLVFQEISAYLSARMQTHQALRLTLEGQPLHGRLGKALDKVLEDTQPGKPLSQLMADQPLLLTDNELALVKKAESLNALPEVLDFLGDTWAEQAHDRRWRRRMLAYPTLLLIIMFLVFNFFGFFVFPRFGAMFSSFGRELPLPTQIMIDIFDVYRVFWWLMIPMGGGVAFLAWSRHPALARVRGRLVAAWPTFLTPAPHLFVKRFSTLLQRLSSRRMEPLPALELAILGALAPGERLDGLGEQEASVEDFCQQMTDSGRFPPHVSRLVRAGVQSGLLPELMAKVTRMSEHSARFTAERVYGTLRVFLYLLAAGLGIFMIISTFLPIFAMGSML